MECGDALYPLLMALFVSNCSPVLRAQGGNIFDVTSCVISPSGVVSGSVTERADRLRHYGFIRDTNGSITLFRVPPGFQTDVTAANAAGDIVGEFQRTDLTVHGYFRNQNGTFVTVDFPQQPETYTRLNAVNARGDAVGNFNDALGDLHAFLFRHGTFVRIDVPGGTATIPAGINQSGVIVGNYSSDGQFHAFVRYGGGTFAKLDVPGAQQSFATGINSQGEIVGYYGDSQGNTVGFLWDSHVGFTTIAPPLKVANTFATAISEAGDVAGISFTASTPYGFLRTTDGSYALFSAPDAVSMYVFSVNSRGDVCGTFYSSSQSHGYIRYRSGVFQQFDIIAP